MSYQVDREQQLKTAIQYGRFGSVASLKAQGVGEEPEKKAVKKTAAKKTAKKTTTKKS